MDANFLLKKLESMDSVFVLFSATTKLPFIEKNTETGDYQIYVFDTRDKLKDFSVKYADDAIILSSGQLPGENIKEFFLRLHCFGVSAVNISMVEDTYVKLTDIVEKPGLEDKNDSRLPGLNPELHLAGVLYKQDEMRQIKRNEEQIKELKELEKNLAQIMFKSKYIYALDAGAVEDGMSEEEKRKNLKVPYVKTKNGDIYQPIFTDMGECQGYFSRNSVSEKLRIVTVTYDEIQKNLMERTKGIVINPLGLKLVRTKEQLTKMREDYK